MSTSRMNCLIVHCNEELVKGFENTFVFYELPLVLNIMDGPTDMLGHLQPLAFKVDDESPVHPLFATLFPGRRAQAIRWVSLGGVQDGFRYAEALVELGDWSALCSAQIRDSDLSDQALAEGVGKAIRIE